MKTLRNLLCLAKTDKADRCYAEAALAARMLAKWRAHAEGDITAVKAKPQTDRRRKVLLQKTFTMPQG